jgi:Tol biopolymer transport system component
MGEVYRARDTRLDRDVAIKVLPEGLASDPDALARFEREAKAVAALSHPNILSIHDVGRVDGTAYAVMELLQGQTLRDRLAEGAIPRRKAIDYAVQIAQGLAAAHARGIVHRDLKPDNVFLTTEGRAKILDFGLARTSPVRTEGTQSPTLVSATQPGTVMGTVGYMSPEQVRGLPADHRSDIFSFGAVLYEMLSGQRAFRGDSAVETMNAILKEDPPDLSAAGRDLPPGLERIVQHCLEKDPEQRFQSVRDVAFDLETLTGSAVGRPTAIHPAPRRKLSLWLLLPAALLLVAAAFLAGRRTGSSPATARADAGAASFTKLTEEGGVERFPSLSPDGKSLAYVSEADGDADIYVRRVGGYKSVNLTPESSEDELSPTFSPNGKLIAFSSQRGGVYTMGATGESMRRISDFGSNPAWSPDGREIAVATESALDPFARASPDSQLWALDVSTGEKRRIPTGDAVQPNWSPGGGRIAYWGLRQGKAGQRDVWTVGSRGGGSPVSVTDDTFVDWSPVWSRDGKYLYFGSDRGGTMNLWRVAIDEETGETLGPPEPFTTPSVWSGYYAFSGNGRQLAFTALEQRTDVARVAFDPVSGRVVGFPEPVLGGSRDIIALDVSPDGSWIVFTQRGPLEDVFIARTDGSGLRQLTEDAFRDRGPSWSPDGKRIAFYSNRTGRYELWTIRPDGSALEQITEGDKSDFWFPHWSPDGTQIAAPSAIGSHLVTPGGSPQSTKVKTLPGFSKEEHFRVTSWSPDGTHLVGNEARTRDGQSVGVVLYSLASGRYERLPVEGFPAVRPVFRSPKYLPDGRHLIYESEAGVSLYDMASRRSRAILPAETGKTIREVIPSPDGRWLYLVRTTDEGDVWQMEIGPSSPP